MDFGLYNVAWTVGAAGRLYLIHTEILEELMPDMKPLGAQISHMLKDRGVDAIFGIPGVHNQEMYRGIEEAGIRHILARHEQGAGLHGGWLCAGQR
jgi:hypothetical protein